MSSVDPSTGEDHPRPKYSIGLGLFFTGPYSTKELPQRLMEATGTRPKVYSMWTKVPFTGQGIVARVRVALNMADEVVFDLTEMEPEEVARTWKVGLRSGVLTLRESYRDITNCELLQVLAQPDVLAKTIFTRDGQVLNRDWVQRVYGWPTVPAPEQWEWVLEDSVPPVVLH